MLTSIFEWFFDEDSGGVRRFYLTLGAIFIGIYLYTNHYRINDYDSINNERKELMLERIKLIRINDSLVFTNREYAKIQIKLNQDLDDLLEELKRNKQINEQERQAVSNMSLNDKLSYIANRSTLQVGRSTD